MKYFTDSPYERMMMQKPSTRPRAKGIAAKAGCKGCGYGEKGPCIALCMRKLSASGRKDNTGTGATGDGTGERRDK